MWQMREEIAQEHINPRNPQQKKKLTTKHIIRNQSWERTSRCTKRQKSEGEVRNGIYKLNRRKAFWGDNVAAEILRRNKNRLDPLITDILNDVQYNNMSNNWLQGIVTFIYKNKDPLSLGNYRQITLLNMI